ncbi:MAG: Ig-like domain-containing protein, partial [Candidatus Methanomethylophilaceae archaeon]|nr:Ig-like domain-containing protein [Candidatus Methanomethylophilaceae archaeon]
MSGKAIALIAMAAVVAIAGAVLIFGGAGNGGDGPADATVSLDRSAVEMEAGETVMVSAVVSPSGWSGTVTWTSSDPSVATVSGG